MTPSDDTRQDKGAPRADAGAGNRPGADAAGGLPEPVYRIGPDAGIDDLIRLLDLLADRMSKSERRIDDALRPLREALTRVESQLGAADRGAAESAGPMSPHTAPPPEMSPMPASPAGAAAPDAPSRNDDKTAPRPVLHVVDTPGGYRADGTPPIRSGPPRRDGGAPAPRRPEPPLRPPAPRAEGGPSSARGETAIERLGNLPPGADAPRTSRKGMSVEQRYAYFAEPGDAAIEPAARGGGIGWDEIVPERPGAPGRRDGRSRFLGAMAIGLVLVLSVATGFWAFSTFVARTGSVPGGDERAAGAGSSGLPPALAELAAAHPLRLPARPAGDGQASIVSLRHRAELGDTAAAYALGLAYAAGDGAPLDKAEAVRWLRVAADNGSSAAQYVLAALYHSGLDDDSGPDEKRTLWWLRSAATSGHALAAFALGFRYLAAPGDENRRQGAYWVERAAEEGMADAALALAILRESGIGGPRDLGDAYGWYALAALTGHDLAARRAAALEPDLSDEARQRADALVNRLNPVFLMRAGTAAEPSGEAAGPPATGIEDAIARGDAAIALPPPLAGPSGTDPAANSALIRAIQEELRLLHFEPGALDGTFTPETRDAIRLYQEFAGLDPTGEPSQDLLSHLQSVSASAVKSRPAPVSR